MVSVAYEYEDEFELEGEFEDEFEFEGEFEDEFEFESEFEDEFEYEDEFEFEGEAEWESFAPVVAPATEAMMAHLAHQAARAQSEQEAEAFLGALVPLAARLIPHVAPAVMRAAPQLIRGVANIAHSVWRNPATQQLVRTIPTILSRTAQSLGDQAAAGRPITGQRALATLTTQAGRVLNNPPARRAALQRSRSLDRRYLTQQQARATAARPAGRPAARPAGRPTAARPPAPRPVGRQAGPRPAGGGARRPRNC